MVIFEMLVSGQKFLFTHCMLNRTLNSAFRNIRLGPNCVFFSNVRRSHAADDIVSKPTARNTPDRYRLVKPGCITYARD